jgi:DMSO/TMAO reductase YedYZ heme-binding membrane subunit
VGLSTPASTGERSSALDAAEASTARAAPPETPTRSSRLTTPARQLAQLTVLVLYAGALILPAYAFFHDRGGTSVLNGLTGRPLLQVLFPLVGLYAFTFVTAQVLLTTNLWWLTRLWPRVIHYHRAQGIFALLFAITHPVFILIGFGMATFLANGFVQPSLTRWLIPSYTALALLLLTVATALLGWTGRRITWWRHLHKLNYVVFALVWVHSWNIGTDTQAPTLRTAWQLYLALVVLSSAGRVVHARTHLRNEA